MQLHIQAIASKGLGTISYTAAQNLRMELTAIEERVDKVIRVYGHKIQAARGSQELSQERNNVSDELYGRLRMAKAMNAQMTKIADSSFSRTEGGGDSLEIVPLPTFNRKHKAWADFRRGFRALQGPCDPPIEMVRYRRFRPCGGMVCAKQAIRQKRNYHIQNHCPTPGTKDPQGLWIQARRSKAWEWQEHA